MDHVRSDKPASQDGWWLIAVISPLLLLGGWMLWPKTPGPSVAWLSPEISVPARETIASQWQTPTSLPPTPTAVQDQAAPATGTAELREISLDRLQHALAHIAVDQDGNLILDEVALASLQQAFRAVGDLDPAMIQELQLYVQAGLAGETGEQASAILGNYVRYRYNLTDAQQAWAQEGLTPHQRLERTIELRREAMGPVTASQLFAGEEAHQRYLIGMEEIRTNTRLSEQQRQQAQSAIRDDLRSGRLLVDISDPRVDDRLRQNRAQWQQLGLPEETRHRLERQSLGLIAARDLAGSDSEDWYRRFAQFEREREAIFRAGLTEAEKQRQAEELEATYFTPAERDAAVNWLPHHLRDEAVPY